MCSLGDEYEYSSDKNMPASTKIDITELQCNKCKDGKPIILLREKDPYCKDCFLSGTNHKFKSLLGKSHLIRPNDKVLISYEVGHASIALMHLIRDGLNLNTPKKLKFEPLFVYIEDLYNSTVEERKEIIQVIIRQTKSLNFTIQFIPLIDFITSQKIVLYNDFTQIEDDKDKYFSIFKKNTNETYRNEILNLYKRKLLIAVAKMLNCKFIFTPQISADIASNLLTNISLGRGDQVPLDTGFCDNRDNSVQILRPLKSFSLNELIFYNELHGLESAMNIKQKNLKMNQYSSVQNLIKKFISDLQENYPATISTIVKTGDKLDVRNRKDLNKCKLCQGQITEKSFELDSEESTSFSKLVSNELIDHNLSRQETYENIKMKFNNKSMLEQNYCYSCTKISEYLLEV